MNRKLMLTTAGIYLAIAGLVFSVSAVFKEQPIRASVKPNRIVAGDNIYFADSTRNAEHVKWEFGNGESTEEEKGKYAFAEAGNYLVKLTVDKKKEKTFLVQVMPPPPVASGDSMIMIIAGTSGIAGQKIHFKALGKGIEWCEWKFGVSGKIDARNPEAFYTFRKPGVYNVTLETNLNKNKPAKHKITILPQYEVTEPVLTEKKPKKSGGGGGGAPSSGDLLDVLQAIARGENFNANYKLAVNKFLCANPNTPVVVNDAMSSDFYSYCQNLKIKTGQTVADVQTEINPNTNCVSRLIIKHQ
ncbi:PKD domain-containing protein [Cytophagaceae bacterium ABcell3]|nr:PKD domain-containing protein [Cytophagaceae bacterium ABcell3]